MNKTLTLTNDLSQVSVLTEWIELLGEEISLPMSSVFQLTLALEEAVVNVINYAYPQDEQHSFMLEVTDADAPLLTFLLIDEGAPFDPTQHEAPDTTLSAEERQIGGLGIFLVEQIMHDVTYRRTDGKNILTMIFDPTTTDINNN